jgi:hypothetical protein
MAEKAVEVAALPVVLEVITAGRSAEVSTRNEYAPVPPLACPANTVFCATAVGLKVADVVRLETVNRTGRSPIEVTEPEADNIRLQLVGDVEGTFPVLELVEEK